MKKLIVLTLISLISINYINNNEYVEIPKNSLRFRIIANSNNKIDLENKQILKERGK